MSSASSPVPVPLKTADINIDPHGDITLAITTALGTVYFRVNSDVMCLASPVIRAMLGPDSPFKEARDLAASSKAGTPLEVRLEDDDPQAMAVILRILHLQFDLVPTDPATVDEVKLYQMAIICDKYDMQRVLRYWFKLWTGRVPIDGDGPLSIAGPKWLFMAYAFGHETLFTKLSRELMLQCEVTGDGRLVLPGIKHPIFDDNFVPEIVMDAIAASRLQAIEGIVDHIHKQIEYYYPTTSDGGLTPFRCRHNRDQHICDALTLGLLLREVRRLNVYPTLPPEVARKSVTYLVQLLNGLTFPMMTKSSGGCCAVPDLPECHTGGSYCLRCVTCMNCNRRYRPGTIGTRHDGKCLPVQRFKRGLVEIVDCVKGVDFGMFARDTKHRDNVTKPSDLWNSVQFA
ncbi:hypothetical protein BGX38DRAFT_1192759 [Terfezia claveryi]|nr:hypothetical protein BGX38DRAFT_1192759 [Terfezia claveryi]